MNAFTASPLPNCADGGYRFPQLSVMAAAMTVRSMGATFIELELEALEGAGGYAREMTEAVQLS